MMEELYAYMGAVCKTNGLVPVKFGGTEDHIHLVIGMSRTITIAKAVEAIKTSSSKWAKEKVHPEFTWQVGYGVFSVSHRELPGMVHYVEKQAEHHRKISFQDELRSLLLEHGIPFDERYLWD